MDLSISIVSWNTRDLLDQCLKSVYDTTQGIEFEAIVVDNASSDGSAELVREKYPQARVIENQENVGFAKANNQAYGISTGRYFLLLNPDTICLPGSLSGLVAFLAEIAEAGAVGPLVLNSDKTLQYSWAKFPTLLSESLGRLDRRIKAANPYPKTVDDVRALEPFMVDWIGGCCLMIKRESVEQIGLMDESLFMYSEETDWCLCLHKSGWEVWVEPSAEIIHLGGQSSMQAKTETEKFLRKSKEIYFKKHHGYLASTTLGAILALKAFLRNNF